MLSVPQARGLNSHRTVSAYGLAHMRLIGNRVLAVSAYWRVTGFARLSHVNRSTGMAPPGCAIERTATACWCMTDRELRVSSGCEANFCNMRDLTITLFRQTLSTH